MRMFMVALLSTSILVAQESFFTSPPGTTQETEVNRHALQRSQVAVVEILNTMNIKQMIKKLMEIEQDDTIDGVILVIDHAGGSVSSLCVIHDMIKAIAVKKPIVGLVVGQALSCGYLIASASNYLIAHSMSEVGSIGIFYDITRYRDAHVTDHDIDAQLDKQMICAGKFKLAHHPFGPEPTKEIRQYVESNAQALYNTFIHTVAHNRNIAVERACEWADGKFFISFQALQLGLIDEIGTLFTAKSKMRELIQARNPSKPAPTDINLVFDNE